MLLSQRRFEQDIAVQEHDLGFAKITVLSLHIAEVIVAAGVDVTRAMIEQCHAFLLTHLQAPIFLLLNNVHSYSYTFEAQTHLAEISDIRALAAVSYNEATTVATRTLAALPREAKWTIELFSDRDAALAWLTVLTNTQR